MDRVLYGWGRRLANRFRGRDHDRGAGFVEYAGLLLLIATIVVAVVALNLDTQVSNAVRDAVGKILD